MWTSSLECILTTILLFCFPPDSVDVVCYAILRPQAALRELKEECGYVGKASSKSPGLCLSPGLSNETAAFVRIDIDLDGACLQRARCVLRCEFCWGACK